MATPPLLSLCHNSRHNPNANIRGVCSCLEAYSKSFYLYLSHLPNKHTRGCRPRPPLPGLELPHATFPLSTSPPLSSVSKWIVTNITGNMMNIFIFGDVGTRFE